MSNDIIDAVAKMDKTFGFGANHGGSIDVVAGSSRAASAAQHILSSLNHSSNVAKEAGMAVGVAAAASFAALGDLSPIALGMAGMAGVVSSISKGSQRK